MSGLITGLLGATAARLRFQKGRNIPDPVANRRSVDSPERATDIQSPLPLQHLHAAPADGGVDVLIDPREWDRRRGLRAVGAADLSGPCVAPGPIRRSPFLKPLGGF